MEEALADSVPDLATPRFLLKNLAHHPAGGFCWRGGLHEIRAAYHDLSAMITGSPPYGEPVLFLRGERSDYLRESEVPEIRRLFPRAQMRVVPRAGHWVQVDNSDALIRLALEFWRSQKGIRAEV